MANSSKNSKKHPNDLRIGKNDWIRFVDISNRTEKGADLDIFLKPMERFWRALEINCVAECCGIAAHSFLPQDIWNAVRVCSDKELDAKLLKARQFIDSYAGNCVCSNILNQRLDKTVFSQLLDHIRTTLHRM